MFSTITKWVNLAITVIGLVKQLVALINKFQREQAEKKSQEAYEKMKKAETIDEVQDANEEITRNMP